MTNNQELIRNEYAEKYATNWFKMNEGSGTTLRDSKGSATVGTINGATWLSDGGLSFNGSSYVTFNGGVIPRGMKSVRFKVKANLSDVSNTPYLVASSTGGSDYGFRCSFLDGKIFIQVLQSTPIFNLSSTTIVADGQWHDVLFTWDGTTNANGVKIYIDDMQTPNNKTTAISLENTNPSYNLRMGASPSNGDILFKGQLKGLEIYNQDLSKIKLNKTLILHEQKYKSYPKIQELTPKMNSNNENGLVLSSSEPYNANSLIYKAFDKDAVDQYHSLSQVAPFFVSVENTIGNFMVKYFTIKTRNDSAYNEAPSTMMLQMSNDGVNWYDAGSYGNITWSQGETKTFFCKDNSQFYKHIRLSIPITGGRGFLCIPELQFFGYKNDFVNWSTLSSNLPTQEQFLSDGMDSLSPLLDRRVETLEPIKMDSKSEILQVGETGKVFSQTIKLKKYLDIRNMKVEVK